jgi:hypothetical protein
MPATITGPEPKALCKPELPTGSKPASGYAEALAKGCALADCPAILTRISPGPSLEPVSLPIYTSTILEAQGCRSLRFVASPRIIGQRSVGRAEAIRRTGWHGRPRQQV